MGIAAVLLVLFMAVGVAEEERTDASGLWKYVLEDGGAMITGYEEEPSGVLVIPGEVDGHTVTGIGLEAFYMCGDLIRVIIPDSVTRIDIEAFEGCSGLTDVTIPANATSIEDKAFFECSSLTSVTIPNSVTYIGKEAFNRCNGLTLTVRLGSYAEDYAKKNEIPYEYIVE